MRVIITESQLLTILLEAMNVQDIYAMYYSDLDRNLYNKVVQADPTFDGQKMGKYTKWLLGLVRRDRLTEGDISEAKNLLEVFDRYKNRLEVRDVTRLQSMRDLYDVVKPYMNGDKATSKSDEKRQAKSGAEKVYEDDEWIVVIPHTEEASKLYGKGTKWCTAADHANMFDYYNDQGNLYVNIKKKNEEKYQFHFEDDQFMDAQNHAIKDPIIQTIGMTPELTKWYFNTVGKEDFGKLLGYVTNDSDTNKYFYVVFDEGENLFVLDDMRFILDKPAQFIGDNPVDDRYFRVELKQDVWNLYDIKLKKFMLDTNVEYISMTEEHGWVNLVINDQLGWRGLRLSDGKVFPDDMTNHYDTFCAFSETEVWTGGHLNFSQVPFDR